MMGHQVDKKSQNCIGIACSTKFQCSSICKRVYKFEAWKTDILHFVLRGFGNRESEMRGEESSLSEHSSGSAVQEVKSGGSTCHATTHCVSQESRKERERKLKAAGVTVAPAPGNRDRRE